jgi:hypoxanthine phosphoribosyltransferase
MDKIVYNDEVFSEFISEARIQSRILEMGEQITKDFKGKCPIFIGVLNGACIFFGDLLKSYSGECEVDFAKVSSYGSSKYSSGSIKVLKDIDSIVNERDLIVVEDIVDTGLSLKFILNLLGQKNPSSIRVATLLFKPAALKYDIKIDYTGFEIENKFVIGYGMDLSQKYRNLRSIYALDK